MNGVTGISGPARTWRARVRAAAAAGDREERDAPQRRAAYVRARAETGRRREHRADATTAYFAQLLDQPAPRGMCADLGLRRLWSESYVDAVRMGAPRLISTTDERA